MKYTVTYTSIADAVLARSALCGSITKRGNMLVDNDDYALRTIMDTVVPAALWDYNIPYRGHKCGWRVGPTSIPKETLLRYLTGNLLYTLTNDTAFLDASFGPTASAANLSESSPGLYSDLPSIRPYSF